MARGVFKHHSNEGDGADGIAGDCEIGADLREVRPDRVRIGKQRAIELELVAREIGDDVVSEAGPEDEGIDTPPTC